MLISITGNRWWFSRYILDATLFKTTWETPLLGIHCGSIVLGPCGDYLGLLGKLGFGFLITRGYFHETVVWRCLASQLLSTSLWEFLMLTLQPFRWCPFPSPWYPCETLIPAWLKKNSYQVGIKDSPWNRDGRLWSIQIASARS